MTGRALSVLLYGESGSGKSTYATTGPAPRLIIDLESSARFLVHLNKRTWDPHTEEPPVYDGTWDTAVVNAHTFEDVQKAYDWLKSGRHPFKTVVVDSFSELQVRAQEAINGRNSMKMQMWGELLSKMGFMGRDLRDLTTHKTNPLEAVVIITTMQIRDGK